MFNPKLRLFLLINCALFTLGMVLSADNEIIDEVAHDAQARAEKEAQVISADTAEAVIEPQFSPVAPAPLVIEKKESREKIKRLLQEKQKAAEERALLQAQLAAALQQNKILQGQIAYLEDDAASQSGYISELQKNNRALQASIRKPPAAIASESELLKTHIQSQPDLIDPKGDSTDELNRQPDLAQQEDNFSGAVEFGFSYDQDNQVKREINGRLVLDYEQASEYKLHSDAQFEMAERDSKKSSSKYRWQLQTDSYLDPSNLVFARSDINRSKFASYKREDIYTVGYGRIFFDENKHKFNMEIGPGYRMAVPNDGANALSVDEFIARTRLNYERVVSKSLQIAVNTVWEMGRENSIYSVNFKAQNKIYRELYLIFDFEYKYTQNVPVDTVNKDISTGLKLLYAF